MLSVTYSIAFSVSVVCCATTCYFFQAWFLLLLSLCSYCIFFCVVLLCTA